ncbi:hypothetical protein ACRYI5_03170 [Furfurilactobacillus sp. WILCCON 0119]
MDHETFKAYLETNSNIWPIYYEQALAFQQARNQRRLAAKQWNDTQLDRTVDKMFVPVLENIYNRIAAALGSNVTDDHAWRTFIESNHVFEDIEESMTEIEFN